MSDYSANIELTPEAQRILKALRTLPERMGTEVAKVLDLQNELTVGRIQRRYMSRRGGKTLGVVTNRLRSSVWASRAQVSGQDVRSSIGSNVEYAGVHEFGFQGSMNIRAHTRRIDQAFGVPLPATVNANVRAHSRQVKFPERAPIRRGLRDRLPEYGREISDALVRTAIES